jgi:hypothetical protein
MYFAAVPATVVMPGLVPVNAVLSVAVTVCTVPTVVLVVNTTVATPLPFVVLVGLPNDPPTPVLLHVTTLPNVETTLLFASINCAVIVTPVPATGLPLLVLTAYFASAPATVVIPGLVPVNNVLSVATTVCTVPATVLVVNTTVATPLPSVVLVALPNDPPLPVLLHVTTFPDVSTGLLLPSTNCALIVTPVPATGLVPLVLTTYFAAAPMTVVILGLVPVNPPPSVPVTVCTVPTTPLVVNTTAAIPFPSVILVALPNDPPLPVLLHVTTLPGVFNGLFDPSTNCAHTVTVSPPTGFGRLTVTRYFVGGPETVVILGLVPVNPPPSVPVTV